MKKQQIYCIVENGNSWYHNDGKIASGFNFLAQGRWRPEWDDIYDKIPMPEFNINYPAVYDAVT